jgi:transposase InsO family protein
VKDYSKIAYPLQKLLCGEKKKKSEKKKVKDLPFIWGDEQQDSFNRLIDALTNAPTLAFADFSKPFVLHTDASLQGLGAVLSQEHDGLLKPIAFASRSLSPSEKNYPIHKLEFLAMKWAICEKFHDYLYSSSFQVVTDNNPLTYVMSTAKLDATGLRWVSELSLYNFSIKYKAGRLNQAADALSRLDNLSEMTDSSVKAVCQGAQVTEYVSSLSVTVSSLPDDDEVSLVHQLEDSMTWNDWVELQSQDQGIQDVREALENNQNLVPDSSEVKHLWRQRRQLVLQDGVLFRKRKDGQQEVKQLVLPPECRDDAMKMLHNEMGHLGRDRVLELARSRFYWPHMKKDIEGWIAECDRCIRRKQPTNQRAALEHLKSERPMELVCIDFLSLEPSVGGYSNVLVLTDNFTKYAMGIATKNQTAKTTARALVDLFVNNYGLPERIHSDQGSNFTSKIIKQMCEILGIKRSRTTPYHPQSNGQTERMNSTLLSMLGTLEYEKKKRWKEYLQPMIHAYNCTRHETTGYSPFELMFGRAPRLPVDIKYGLQNVEEGEKPYHEYIRDLKKKMTEVYEIARNNIEKAQRRSKARYDRKVKGTSLECGDLVLIKKVTFEIGKQHKLADRWEDAPYEVVKKMEGMPVYDVRPQNGKGRVKRLHRNMLLPIGRKKEESESESEESEESDESGDDEEVSEVTEVRQEQNEEEAESEEGEQEVETREEKTQGVESSQEKSKEEKRRAKKSKENQPLRRSSRERRPPVKFTTGEYVTNFQGSASTDDQRLVLLNRMLDFLGK